MTEDLPKPATELPASIFKTELKPHRSLSPKAFVVLMTGVAMFSFAAGLGFFMAGAWPVIGFLGADVLLVYVAFKISYRRAALTETLELTSEALVVERVTPDGEVSRWRFQPYWLQVMMDEPPSHGSQLTLRSHGQDLTIGSFLTTEERYDLATALKHALRRARCRAAPV